MRRAFCLLGPLFVIGYLYAQWSEWFPQIDQETVWKRPPISEPLYLKHPGSIEWLVPKEGLIVKEGEADLVLWMNLPTLPEIPSERDQLDLRVKVRAEGRVPGGEWQDRLIRDGNFTTDEPFSKEGKAFWNFIGRGRLEYGLARVHVIAEEELRIILDVLVPDNQLYWGIPRLKLVGKYVTSEPGTTMGFRALLRDGGYWLSILLVIFMALFSWPLKTNP